MKNFYVFHLISILFLFYFFLVSSLNLVSFAILLLFLYRKGRRIKMFNLDFFTFIILFNIFILFKIVFVLDNVFNSRQHSTFSFHLFLLSYLKHLVAFYNINIFYSYFNLFNTVNLQKELTMNLYFLF